MIATYEQMNSYCRLAMRRLIGLGLFIVTLGFVFPFFLVIVAVGTASTGVAALAGRCSKQQRNRSFAGCGKKTFIRRTMKMITGWFLFGAAFSAIS